MKVWMSDTIAPTDPDPDWLVIPRVKTQKGLEELEDYLNAFNCSTLTVELYSVDDVDWLETLHNGARDLAEHLELDTWQVNVHVHTDDQLAIDYIEASSYLNYVPLVGV